MYTAIDAKLAPPPIGEYTITRVREGVGLLLALCAASDSSCANILHYTNPTIRFSIPDKDATQVYNGLIGSKVLTPILSHRDTARLPESDVPDVFIMKSPRKNCQKQLFKASSSFVGFATSATDATIQYYKHDPRLRLLDNTLDSPANIAPARDSGLFGHSGAQAQCPLVKPNHLNQGKCVRHTEGTCSPLEFLGEKTMKLDGASLRLWYTTSHKIVLAVEGLPSPTASPCTPRRLSRWRLVAGTCQGGPSLDPATKATLLEALQKQNTMCDTVFARVPDDDRSYSSVSGNTPPGFGFARSQIDSKAPWVPTQNQAGEFVQFDLGTAQTVVGTVVQGVLSRSGKKEYVTKYKVQHSLDGKNWVDVPGEHDGGFEVTTSYFTPVSAQYVRLVVLAWKVRIVLKADLVLCRPGTSANPNIRDVVVSDLTDGTCVDSKTTAGAKIQVAKNTCWEHVHPDTLNVYDFTEPSLHFCPLRGLPNAGWYKRNQFSFVAETGSYLLKYSGTEKEWESLKKKGVMIDNKYAITLKYVGRLGDSIQFQNLDPDLQTLPMADVLGVKSTASSVAFDACGSRAEVQNNPLRGNTLWFSDVRCKDLRINREHRQLDIFYNTIERGKEYVFPNIVLKSADQLRQRVAWALSQVLVLAEPVCRFSSLTYAPDPILILIVYMIAYLFAR